MKKMIGVLFGQRSQLWWDIPVVDSFELLKEIYSLSTFQYKQKLDELTELLQLQELLRTPTRQLSLGQRMRCEIAASLLHDPSLLFLLGASFCFYTIEDTRVLHILTYGAKEHGKYPLDVYGKGIMRFCTYIIPYTLIQYYPLQYLLGKTTQWQYALYPLGGIVFLIVCYAAWLVGVRNYTSCGS